MSKRIPITQFMPLEVTEWLHSPNVQAMWAEQRAWYLHLLLQAWINTSRPCHLPNDENMLWTLAGAKSQVYFDARRAKVVSMFRVCGGGRWLCNVKSLRLYLDKLSTYLQQKIPVETLIFIFNDCTCLSKEEKERLRGNDGKSKDIESLVATIRGIGFRDSGSIAVEHSIVDELAGGASERGLVDGLRRIYAWTEGGTYAPRLHEVIRRWKEPQHLWERKATKRAAPPPMGMFPTSIPYYTNVIRCHVCGTGLGPRGPGDALNDVFVCSDECAAKSGYELEGSTNQTKGANRG